MGTTNTLDLNNRIDALKKSVTENVEDTHDSEKDIYAVMGQMGAKNLIPYPYSEMSSQLHGITFTVNNDGSITLSGTAEQNVNLKLLTQDTPNIRKILLNAGNIILSGGQSNNIYIQFWNYDGNNNYIQNKGNDTPISFSNQNANFNLVLYVNKDTAILTPITIYPMLRLASDTDPTYQPYAKTNKQLTDEIATKTKNFQGTIAEWNQLTTAEKKAYDHASIPDSIDGGVTFPANKVVMTGGGNVEDAIIWKYLMTISDNNPHAITVPFREIYALGNFGSMCVTLLKDAIGARGGFYNTSSDNGDIYLTYSNGAITVSHYVINGVEQIHNGVAIYYR